MKRVHWQINRGLVLKVGYNVEEAAPKARSIVSSQISIAVHDPLILVGNVVAREIFGIHG